VGEGLNSYTDFMHLFVDEKDIVIFKNSRGMFDDVKCLKFNPHFKEALNKTTDTITIPFRAFRQHYMVLAERLEFFFLPFRHDADMDNYISPNSTFNGKQICHLSKDDIARIAGTNCGGWLNDECIDFMVRW